MVQSIYDIIQNKQSVEQDMLNFAKCDHSGRSVIGRNLREMLELWINICGSEKKETTLSKALKSA